MNQFENIPEELKQLPQWVCHRNKIPFNPLNGAPAKAGQPDSYEDISLLRTLVLDKHPLLL